MSEIEDLDDDNRLNRNQRIRDNAISFLAGSNFLPDNKEDRDLLVTLLNDSDRSVFTKRRLKSDDKKSDVTLAIINAGVELLKNIKPSDFGNDLKEPLVLPVDLSNVSVNPGEIDIGGQVIQLEDIMKDKNEIADLDKED